MGYIIWCRDLLWALWSADILHYPLIAIAHRLKAATAWISYSNRNQVNGWLMTRSLVAKI